MSKTIEDKFKNWEITKSEYNSYKKQLENEVYWKKQNEQQNNKLTSEWNTNWKILVNWKLEFPNEINTKKEEPITQKEEPITKYEYNPNDAEMQQALERAKLTNQAYFCPAAILIPQILVVCLLLWCHGDTVQFEF